MAAHSPDDELLMMLAPYESAMCRGKLRRWNTTLRKHTDHYRGTCEIYAGSGFQNQFDKRAWKSRPGLCHYFKYTTYKYSDPVLQSGLPAKAINLSNTSPTQANTKRSS
ncbi:hypothetical protein LTR97_006468 [Elasticomyces elasticus]|uniref:Uncharacterized protein n=1 Tax=Elasticomyces elasticus TaxID=574655 RepID=A0AAN7W4S7_9PEZI|nr:hypothetical protein LTR97_006468 [Elasticomyces elasticus]